MANTYCTRADLRGVIINDILGAHLGMADVTREDAAIVEAAKTVAKAVKKSTLEGTRLARAAQWANIQGALGLLYSGTVDTPAFGLAIAGLGGESKSADEPEAEADPETK